MARRKKPENETQEEMEIRQSLEFISNVANRSEKTSWNRKMDSMVKLMSKLQPIEEKIVDLVAEKQPIYDDIEKLRRVMVNECIHPYEYLVKYDNWVLCKFCNNRITNQYAKNKKT